MCSYILFITIYDIYLLEKEMATHSSVLAWRIPGAGEPGGLQSMGSHRVGHYWRDLAAASDHRKKQENSKCDVQNWKENKKEFENLEKEF